MRRAGSARQPASGRADRVDSALEVEIPSDWTTAETVLDRVHQAMLLFAKGRSDALKRFLVDDSIGKEARFWKTRPIALGFVSAGDGREALGRWGARPEEGAGVIIR